jgi:hypothetical protein
MELSRVLTPRGAADDRWPVDDVADQLLNMDVRVQDSLGRRGQHQRVGQVAGCEEQRDGTYQVEVQDGERTRVL